MFRPIFTVVFGIAIALPGSAPAQSQKQDSGQDKNFDVRSSVGDLHVGSDADERKAGLPLYPGARLRHDEENSNAVTRTMSAPRPIIPTMLTRAPAYTRY